MTIFDPTIEIKAIRHRLGAEFDYDVDTLTQGDEYQWVALAAAGRAGFEINYVRRGPVNPAVVSQNIGARYECLLI